MAVARKCDRCGMYFDIPEDIHPSGFYWMNGAGAAGESIDLCADCCDKLSEWIEGERETLSEPKSEILGDTFLEEEKDGWVEVKPGARLDEVFRDMAPKPAEAPQSDSDDVPEETGEVITSRPDKPKADAETIVKERLGGKKPKQIAEEYGLKPNTVSKYITVFKTENPDRYAELEQSAKNR